MALKGDKVSLKGGRRTLHPHNPGTGDLGRSKGGTCALPTQRRRWDWMKKTNFAGREADAFGQNLL